MFGSTPLATGMVGASVAPAPFLVALVSYIQDVTGLAVYLGHLDQSTTVYPALSVLQVSGNDNSTLAGGTGLASARYQFDAYSSDYVDVLVAVDQLKMALHGFQGLMGGNMVQSLTVSGGTTGWESLTDNKTKGRHRGTIEVEAYFPAVYWQPQG